MKAGVQDIHVDACVFEREKSGPKLRQFVVRIFTSKQLEVLLPEGKVMFDGETQSVCSWS